MRTSETGLALIKRFEGFPHDGRPYQDPVGVWTRGYGRTEGIGPDSRRISERAASRELVRLLARRYEPEVNALALRLPLTQNQFDALVSFVYNLGPGAIGPDTGIGRALRRREWSPAADEMLRWDKAGGQTLLGLARRREAERALFLRPVPIRFTRGERRLMRLPVTRARRWALRAAARRVQLAARATGWEEHDRSRRFQALRQRAL